MITLKFVKRYAGWLPGSTGNFPRLVAQTLMQHGLVELINDDGDPDHGSPDGNDGVPEHHLSEVLEQVEAQQKEDRANWEKHQVDLSYNKVKNAHKDG